MHKLVLVVLLFIATSVLAKSLVDQKDDKVRSELQALNTKVTAELNDDKSKNKNDRYTVEYYTTLEVTLSLIKISTFKCADKNEVTQKILYEFDPKKRWINNIPNAAKDLINLIESSCNK